MMNKLTCMTVLVIAGALGLGSSAQARGYAGYHGADTYQPRFERRVDRRQDRQWSRIQNGIDSGELSRREARRLIKQQHRIDRLEDRFERDGYYSPREKRKMERVLDRASRKIKRAKHNDRGWRGDGHGWRRWHHSKWEDANVYPSYDDSYAASSSASASVTAQTDGFSISWNRSRQY
jgi:hypothetical protein